ncbi:MAG TPA: hypothetical protein PKX48_01435 [Planctomycetota bacterium]|jgi:hypothetical protein|nr:hypothetical protein [Planctomycetota bacterium]OQC22080.1 MAG: hypothetical protein BWX69_00391 [Planctomycetes bacterium ADurb.Bin069]HNR98037.1 hypothetical protein [Planctomycetota bacterium]HNU25786.1 hypothetical protein [Planctomycetota bacterium]HOE28660.1 hypothetical protein [Planctomycetota bacterium]
MADKRREPRDKDPRAGGAEAVPIGPAQMVKPLAAALAGADPDAARAAVRALRRLASAAGRPGADDDRAAVVWALTPYLAKDKPRELRREVLWLLADLAGGETVGAVAALLGEPELREDARMALERIPGEESLAALRAAFAGAPEDFKPNVAHSLRRRGVAVEGYPSARLVPVKGTSVGA